MKTSLYSSQSIIFSLLFYAFPEDFCLSHFARKFQLHSYEFEMEENEEIKIMSGLHALTMKARAIKLLLTRTFVLEVDLVVAIKIRRNLD